MHIVSDKSMRSLNVRLLRDIRLGLFEIFSCKYIEKLICVYSEWVEIRFWAVKSQKKLFIVAWNKIYPEYLSIFRIYS